MDDLAYDTSSSKEFKELLEVAMAEIANETDYADQQRRIASHLLSFFMVGVSVGIQMERQEVP